MRGTQNVAEPCPSCHDIQAERTAKLREVANMPSKSAEEGNTFETFTISQGKQQAYDAAYEFAKVDTDYKVLTLYGPPGVGKSHL